MEWSMKKSLSHVGVCKQVCSLQLSENETIWKDNETGYIQTLHAQAL